MQPLFVAVGLYPQNESLVGVEVSPDRRLAAALGYEAHDAGGLAWIFFGFCEGANGFSCLRPLITV